MIDLHTALTRLRDDLNQRDSKWQARPHYSAAYPASIHPRWVADKLTALLAQYPRETRPDLELETARQDVGWITRELGLEDCARPYSTHEHIARNIIPAIRALAHPRETEPTPPDLTAPARYVYPTDALYPAEALRLAYANGLAAGQKLAAAPGETDRPQTCATCVSWCAGKSQGEEMRAAYVRNNWTAQCGQGEKFREMFTIYVYGDGRVDDYEFDTPPTFGCNQWASTDAPKENK